MKVLFIASEASPFIKTGGLGDVIGSLPKALKKQKIDVRVILPEYKSISDKFKEKMIVIKEFTVSLSWRNQNCILKECKYDDVTFYFISNDYYFERDSSYNYDDDAERFAFFSKAVLEALPFMDFVPEILHCHDWQTGLISVYLKTQYQNNAYYQNLKTLFTIHNMIYQGVFPKQILGDVLGLDYDIFTMEGLEFYDQVSYFKAGLIYSDLLSTVSQTYAKEIQTPFFGEKLDGLLRKRSSDLTGIINGIDNDDFNPAKDSHIYENYTASQKSKLKNKASLQKELGLDVKATVPMLAIVSRLVSQKGLDLVRAVLEEILALDIQLVILGTGEKQFELMFEQAAEKYPNKVSANINFDEKLARKIYAAADIFLMPSYFEPCGISQLIAMRYSCLPIVRETGGLRDTVRSYNEFTKEGNGFSFANYNAHDMLHTIRRAVDLYEDKKVWSKIMKNARNSDFSWRASAKEYITLYKRLLER